FYSHLSNMYDMYKGLPLSNRVDMGPLNAKIERELLQYLQFKGIKPKEGFDELLEWFLQKGIKVAVISTHRTKDAVQYLQMSNLYKKVQYVIGSDSISSPLPSTQILTNVVDHFQVQKEEVLVLSSFMALNYAANELHMNVIYCQDLVKADFREQETSYKVVSNHFEVLNTLLFDRYNEVEMYSPILGMNEHMNKKELDSIKDKLYSSYQNDPQLLEIVNQTYEYHVSKLKQSTPKIKSCFKPQNDTKFHFNDEEIEEKEEPSIDEDVEISENINTNEVAEPTKEIHITSLEKNEDETLTALLNQINKPKTQETTMPIVIDFDEIKEIVIASHEDVEDDDEVGETSPFITFIINIFYTAAVSLLVLFIGVIVYIGFIHQFQSGSGIFGIISEIFNVYYTFIEYIFKMILDGLNSLTTFIPSYQDYYTHNALFSQEGVKLFNIFFFHFIVMSFVKIVIYFVRRGSYNENNF
ncbi:MAG: HAD hydrolase-like protein, partial [Coprobacillus sp.]